MSTNNPKVSAYIPQHIYDSFKLFCEQRGVSMSQAVAVIFAEYFGLDSSVNQKSSTSKPLVERVGLLEQELADLRGLVENHLKLRGVIDKKEHLVVHDGSSPEGVSLEVPKSTSVTPSEPLRKDSLLSVELPEVLENVEASSAEGDLPEMTPSKLVDGIPGELLGNSDLPEAKSSEVLENGEIPLAGDELAEATRSEAVGSIPGEPLQDGDVSETESPEVKSAEVLENLEASLAGGDLSEISPSEPVSILPSESLKNHELLENVKGETATGQESLSYSEVPLFPIPGNSPEEIQPISARKLSKHRFGGSEHSVAGAKKKYKNSPQKFIDWTKQKDPDGIAWKMVETPVPGYVPANKLPSELRDKLLIWIRENGLL
jgi:hypothetical protein